MKSRELKGKDKNRLNKNEFRKAIVHVLEEHAINYCSDEYENYLKKVAQEKIIFNRIFFSKEDNDEN